MNWRISLLLYPSLIVFLVLVYGYFEQKITKEILSVITILGFFIVLIIIMIIEFSFLQLNSTFKRELITSLLKEVRLNCTYNEKANLKHTEIKNVNLLKKRRIVEYELRDQLSSVDEACTIDSTLLKVYLPFGKTRQITRYKGYLYRIQFDQPFKVNMVINGRKSIKGLTYIDAYFEDNLFVHVEKEDNHLQLLMPTVKSFIKKIQETNVERISVAMNNQNLYIALAKRHIFFNLRRFRSLLTRYTFARNYLLEFKRIVTIAQQLKQDPNLFEKPYV